jgi:hypothetical protein
VVGWAGRELIEFEGWDFWPSPQGRPLDSPGAEESHHSLNQWRGRGHASSHGLMQDDGFYARCNGALTRRGKGEPYDRWCTMWETLIDGGENIWNCRTWGGGQRVWAPMAGLGLDDLRW